MSTDVTASLSMVMVLALAEMCLASNLLLLEASVGSSHQI